MASRARACTLMLESSVPTVVKPSVPSPSTSNKRGSNSETLKSTVNSAINTSATTNTNSKLPSILPKKSALRSMGASNSASKLPRSFSEAKLRPSPKMPAKITVTHNTPATVVWRASLSNSSARLKMSTVISVKRIMALISSRLRISARKSFHAIAPTTRRYGVTGRRVARRVCGTARGSAFGSALIVCSLLLSHPRTARASRRRPVYRCGRCARSCRD